MKRATSLTFIIILVVFFALVVLIPGDKEASVRENRPFAERPVATLETVLSGEFGADYEEYITDNVGFRSKFTDLGTHIENSRGIQSKDNGRIVTLSNGNQLVLNDGKIMELYKENPEARSKYIEVLNIYSQKFGDKSNIYLMLAPTQIEFDNSKYRALADSEKETIDTVYASVKNFKTVNVYDELKEHTDEYIYFRTDHHWTQRGAYYGYSALMKAKGEAPVALEDLKHCRESNFLGYLYNQANDDQYEQYADDIEYFEGEQNYVFTAKIKNEDGTITPYQSSLYMPPAKGEPVTYGIFMGGDHPFAEINTNAGNGQTALVIKDSYANTLLPLLANNYEKILVIDPRNFYSTVTELTKEYKVDDIIFVNYVISTTLPGFIDFIKAIQ